MLRWGGENLPLRLGLENVSYEGILQDIDVFSVTDLSGSMCGTCSGGGSCCIVEVCMWFICWDTDICDYDQPQCEACGGSCDSNAIDSAKQGNDAFIDIILNYSGNRVGLQGYEDSADASDYHALSNDNVSLKAEVASWSANGGTCICCGINAAVSALSSDSTADKYRSIVVMSDGQANVECAEQGTGSATDDAIQAACDAYEDYGIVVNSVGFGASVDNVTLQDIAFCGGGGYFFSNAGELESVYRQVASSVVAQYVAQTIEIAGDVYSRLYWDSYIEFAYTPPAPVYGLVMALEESFYDGYSGNFSVPGDTRLVEARVASYSGASWTDEVEVNGAEIYDLSDYGSEYISLGDPYIVKLPNFLITNGSNNVWLATAVGPGNQSAGSSDNKIIYKLVKNASAFSGVKAAAEGCNWEIELDGGSMMNVTIPETYSGTEVCLYDSVTLGLGLLDSNDALQLAVFNLLKELDLDGDGRIDIVFTEQDLQISFNEVEGIPFTWATEVQARRWLP